MRYLTIFLLLVIIAEMGWLMRPPVTVDDLEASDPTFGATITTIAGSDTLSASRSVINTNFSNLNADIAANLAAASSSLSTVWTFTNDTNFANLTQSTTSIAWFKNGLYASSTSQFANATTSLFSVGTLWQTTSATSTFTGGISMTRFHTTGTSTAANGINLSTGCFAKNGACIGASGGTVGANTASTSKATGNPANHGVITIPANSIGVIFAHVNINGTGGADVTVNLTMGGQVVETMVVDQILSEVGFTYSTTTATTSAISITTADASWSNAYITTLIMPNNPLTD